MSWFFILVVGLILLKWAAQLALEGLNRRNVQAHAGAVPEAFTGIVDGATYEKTVRYTLAKGRLHQVDLTYNTLILLLVLLSGLLPWGFQLFTQHLGPSAWSMAAFLFAIGVV
ncbi:MAG TPA: M48 family peptidase, partial [Bacillota bacterium]|nr:M48 family peptidase [Bacillota bacterium]